MLSSHISWIETVCTNQRCKDIKWVSPILWRRDRKNRNKIVKAIVRVWKSYVFCFLNKNTIILGVYFFIFIIKRGDAIPTIR